MRTTTALASIGFLLSATAVVAERERCGTFDECVQVCENCMVNSSFYCAVDSKCYSSIACRGSPCENETSLCAMNVADCNSAISAFKKVAALAIGMMLLIACAGCVYCGLVIALCCCCYRRRQRIVVVQQTHHVHQPPPVTDQLYSPQAMSYKEYSVGTA